MIINKCAILKKLKSQLVIDKLRAQNLKDNQILVKNKFTYICGSQLNEIFGKKGNDKFLPHLLGHESSGIVYKVGKNIKNFKKNDKVILSWIKNKKKDADNPVYLDSKKKIINSGPISTFSNFSIVGENRVYKLPKNIPMDIGGLFGCAIPTGFGVVTKNLRKFNKEALVGIYGCGGVGIMSLIALKNLGFKNVYCVDKNKKNLKIAKKFGSSKTYKIDKFNYNILLKDFDLNQKKSINLEMSGNQKVMMLAVNTLPNNGICILCGNLKKGLNININPYDLIFGKKILGFAGSNISLKSNINLFSKLIKKKDIHNLRKIIKIYNLNSINKAIKDFKQGKVFRPLIKL